MVVAIVSVYPDRVGFGKVFILVICSSCTLFSIPSVIKTTVNVLLRSVYVNADHEVFTGSAVR